MELIDLTNGRLEAAKKYADSINDDSLDRCLKRLSNYPGAGTTNIYPDFAPLSFCYERHDVDAGYRSNGGIIFHGRHDGYGSVCLEPVNGWSIHT
jgi:hypothetical protein